MNGEDKTEKDTRRVSFRRYKSQVESHCFGFSILKSQFTN